MLLMLLPLSALGVYAYLLNKRLSTPDPNAYAHAAKPISDAELAALTYPTPNDMAKAAGAPTGNAYIVIGGSGFVGRYIVRTLLGRGETLVRIVDIAPPDLSGDSRAKDHLSHAEFVKADITDYESVKNAISRPFGATKVTAQVIIHTAAAIRAWERLSYLKPLSYQVNVDGIKNVLKAAQDLETVSAFVFTSSAATFLPPAKYLRLTLKHGPVYTGDIPPEGAPLIRSHYADSKREADTLVRLADNVKGIRTGVLRPGMAIMGDEEPWITHALSNPQPNVFMGGHCFQSTINVWDLARAHIQFVDALGTRPHEVGGLGFAITGQSTVYVVNEVRRILQACSSRDLRFQQAPCRSTVTTGDMQTDVFDGSALPFYILSHLLEVFFITRFYILGVLSKVTGKKATYTPQWAITSLILNLQPAMWDYLCSDYIIDDSQVRKALGYRNLWSNDQTIKWIADSFENRAK